jgi:hypothetical protein
MIKESWFDEQLDSRLNKHLEEQTDSWEYEVTCSCGWKGDKDELLTQYYQNGSGDDCVCPICRSNEGLEEQT